MSWSASDIASIELDCYDPATLQLGGIVVLRVHFGQHI